MNQKTLPTILIIIDIFSAIPYFTKGDWRHGVYWLAAATLTFTVTW